MNGMSSSKGTFEHYKRDILSIMAIFHTMTRG